MNHLRIGIDLGGTKIEAIALDQDNRERARRRVPTPRDDYEATLAAVAAVVREIESELGSHATVGVGMPGALSPTTLRVKNANSVWLNGRMLAPDLESRLARRIRFANDANCFALSEAVDGAGRGAGSVFGVILGTGTGGGIVVGGRIWTGPNAIAGEWGHNPLPWPRPGEWPGPSCYCGKTACIEAFLSGPALARDHREVTGEARTPEAIEVAAEASEPRAEATLRRYEERLARALAGVINILDPEVVVLGGGLSHLQRLYRNVPLLWPRFVFSDRVDTRLLPPVHGATSGVRGAAWLWAPGEDDSLPGSSPTDL